MTPFAGAIDFSEIPPPSSARVEEFSLSRSEDLHRQNKKDFYLMEVRCESPSYDGKLRWRYRVYSLLLGIETPRNASRIEKVRQREHNSARDRKGRTELVKVQRRCYQQKHNCLGGEEYERAESRTCASGANASDQQLAPLKAANFPPLFSVLFLL